MQAININKKLVDSYLELFKNLSSNTKRDLIEGLSDSLNTDKKGRTNSVGSLATGFIPEKTADELIEEIRSARNFTRKTEEF